MGFRLYYQTKTHRFQRHI